MSNKLNQMNLLNNLQENTLKMQSGFQSLSNIGKNILNLNNPSLAEITNIISSPFTIQKPRIRKVKKQSPPIFITKTHQILSNQEYKQIISWNQQGTYFIIHNIQRFQEEILPIHFRHKNFTSFVRQLNMYDFHKIRNDNNINIFQHKQFKKDNKNCLINIKRKGSNLIRKSSISQIKQNKNNNSSNIDCINQNDNQMSNQQQNQNQDNLSISDHDQFFHENLTAMKNKEQEQNKNYQMIDQKQQRTIESIQKVSNINIKSNSILQQCVFNLEKKLKNDQFLSTIPSVIQTQQQIQSMIKQLKFNSDYKCLNNQKDIKKIITKLRKRLLKNINKMSRKQSNNEQKHNLQKQNQYQFDLDLEQLSIEEQIIADNIYKINQDQYYNLSTNSSTAINKSYISLTILTTQKYLPKSINFLGSLKFLEDAQQHLFYHKMY